MPFEPIISSGFDAMASQRAGYASLNANIESQNANRAVAAQDAVNRWLAQASELRQRAMDSDAARADAAQAATLAQSNLVQDYSFRKSDTAARIAAEDRRTAAQEKKADDQLKSQQAIIEANAKSQTEQASQSVLDNGATFATQYPASKRNYESSRVRYEALEVEKDKLEAENKALGSSGGKTFWGGTRSAPPEAQAKITDNGKRIREITHLLGDRGSATKAYDLAEKQHQKLLDQMKGYQFIPDDENGFIFHGPTKQKFPFNAESLGATLKNTGDPGSELSAGQGGPIAAMSAATTGTTPQPMPAPLVTPRVTPTAPAIAAPMPAPVTGTAQPPTRQWKWDAQSGAIMPTNAPAAPPQRPVIPLAPTNAPVVAPAPAPMLAAGPDWTAGAGHLPRPQAPIIAPPPATNAPAPAPAIVNRKYGSRGYNVTPEDFDRQRTNDLAKLSGMSDTALQKLSDTLGLGYQRYQPGRFSKKMKGGFLGGETITDIGRKALEQMIQAEAERKDLNI